MIEQQSFPSANALIRADPAGGLSGIVAHLVPRSGTSTHFRRKSYVSLNVMPAMSFALVHKEPL
jgi:hypothetical protein